MAEYICESNCYQVEGIVTEGTGAAINGTLAVYPFNEDHTVTSGDNGDYVIESVIFPSDQEYVAGSFSDEALPMAAECQTGDKNLSFKNIGGIIKLSLTGSHSISRITITGNTDELLSGVATVTLGPDGIPSVTMSDDSSPSVSLVCNPAVQLDKETAAEFYISIPPTEFANGFTLTITDSEDKRLEKESGRHNKVTRSSILAMPEISSDNLSEVSYGDNWVDLGLSILWAAYNVGASSPDEYGDYFAWGETYTKNDYSWSNYSHREQSDYNHDHESEGNDCWCWTYKYIGDEISGTSYDAAHVIWGDGARVPTQTEVQELVDNCTFTAGTYNGVKGNYVTGPNGNSIFLPFAGYCYAGKFHEKEGEYGYYWSGRHD